MGFAHDLLIEGGTGHVGLLGISATAVEEAVVALHPEVRAPIHLRGLLQLNPHRPHPLWRPRHQQERQMAGGTRRSIAHKDLLLQCEEDQQGLRQHHERVSA